MKFFVLSNPKTSDTDAVTDFLPADPDLRGDAPTCPVCGKYVAMRPWLPPHLAEIEFWDKQPGDIAFGVGDELPVSGGFHDLYEKAGLTGLHGFKPVRGTNVRRRRNLHP